MTLGPSMDRSFRSGVHEREMRWRRRCLINNQNRRQSRAKLGRLGRQWLLDNFCQKQSLNFGEDERILFPQRENENAKKERGNKKSVARKCQGIQGEPTTAGVSAWKARQAQGFVPDPRGAEKSCRICSVFIWICFLSRGIRGGKGIFRTMIW